MRERWRDFVQNVEDHYRKERYVTVLHRTQAGLSRVRQADSSTSSRGSRVDSSIISRVSRAGSSIISRVSRADSSISSRVSRVE